MTIHTKKDEPVAYMDIHDNWDLYKHKPEQIDVIPLYTHPYNSELRKAAKEALKLLVNIESGYGFEDDSEYAVLDNLRAALDEF